MFLDRSLKRPVEIEAKLGLPLFIAIPDFSRNGHSLAKMTGKSPLLLTEMAGEVASENQIVAHGIANIRCDGFARACGIG